MTDNERRTLIDLKEALDAGIISQGQIEKMVRNHFEDQINHLKDFTNSYKNAVDKCDPEAISSQAYFISSKIKDLKASSKLLTEYQEKQIKDLDTEYVLQFRRLQRGECQCTKKV